MKKASFLLISLMLLLCSCSVDQTLITPITQSFSDMEYTDQTFTLRVELGGKKCVLLASGEVSITDEPKRMVGEIEETLFGENLGITKISWQDGVLTSDGDNTDMTWEELRASLLYAPPVVFEENEIKSAETGSTLSGTLYRHNIKDNSKKDVLYTLLGSALPSLCGITSVVEEETRFENIVCEYILDGDGNPVSYAISFTVLYQDTPPYVPGVTPDKDEYTVEVGVEFRANYKTE